MVLPRTMRPETIRLRVGELVARLTEAGLEHEVVGEVVDHDREAIWAESDERVLARHQHRAEAAEAEAEYRYKKSRDAVAGIPPGQPILVGHHSQRRHEKALETSWKDLGKAVEAGRAAERSTQLAAAAERRIAARENPVPVCTPDDVKVGDDVQIRGLWYEVRRVNKKTVSIPWWGNRDGYDRTDTSPYKKIQTVRRDGVTVWSNQEV